MKATVRRNVEVILQNQHPSGAYIASPSFSNYHYCWLRDGSYIAYAMDLAGETKSADAFFRWVGTTIQRYAKKVDEIETRVKSGRGIDPKQVLNTRFTLEGFEEDADSGWGNFQIDGYGTWLWALSEHIRLTGDKTLVRQLAEAINTTLRYLSLVWQHPNYDCWEEHPEFIHPYSLATVYGGACAADWLVKGGWLDSTVVDASTLAAQVKTFIDRYAVVNGKLVKHLRPANQKSSVSPVSESSVDASLIGAFIPYAVYPLDSPVASETLAAIEKELHRENGGVYRYKTDVYYGGGEWILLSAWLGWASARKGKLVEARSLLKWIESCADERGWLPEQVSGHCLIPAETQPWIDRWGPIATPLLWSHAMAIILEDEISKAEKEQNHKD